ncbi:MAG TPA: hypothetical protein VGK67_33070 [Myxococcales bacterium]|jgi:hypothetical protein
MSAQKRPTAAGPKSDDTVANARRWKKIALGVGAVALLGAGLAFVTREPTPAPAQTATEVPATPPGAAVVLPPEAAAPAPSPEAVAAAAVEAPRAVPVPAAVPVRAVVPASPPEPELAPEVAQELDEAEAALEMGDFSKAVSLANHAVLAQDSSRAHALLTRIACRQGGLGKALEALSKVGARDRPGVIRECKERGIDLE